MSDPKHLQGNFDASDWAKAFVEAVKENPNIPLDEGTMIGWFANALMAGYERGAQVFAPQPTIPYPQNPPGWQIIDG